jgi:beta-1,2-mannobiose phosphorylase / 1,2-beta-oligomannan phosphorylase
LQYSFIHSRRKLLEPILGSPWASEMVLNPSIIQDTTTGRIHMLFRATGPWPEKRVSGKPLPHPIFLGYGWSDDAGQTWQFDLDRPALAPKLEYEIEKIFVTDYKGRKVVNYANGCIEDPRFFYFEGECYITTACRMFPPGPYWEHDEPSQCCPEWIKTEKNPFGKAASENVTVNVLLRVDLTELAKKNYDRAFTYVTHLTNPMFGEDRDVVFFPEKLTIDGANKIVMLQRPFCPEFYPFVKEKLLPSIMICAADRFEDFSNPQLPRQILASPKLEWERNRIGASVTPIKTDSGEWLLNYHGKQDEVVGYTQSFMMLKEQEKGLPIVTHRCTDRMITAYEDWEKPQKSPTPCVFITGMILVGERLIVSYGASDQKVGVLEIDFDALVQHIKKF